VLNISPCKVGVGLQGESDDAGGHGGAGACAGVLGRAAVVQVRRHHLPLLRGPGTAGNVFELSTPAGFELTTLIPQAETIPLRSQCYQQNISRII
jgi:hypothetical protein